MNFETSLSGHIVTNPFPFEFRAAYLSVSNLDKAWSLLNKEAVTANSQGHWYSASEKKEELAGKLQKAAKTAGKALGIISKVSDAVDVIQNTMES